ncbi:tetraacyldisaccharide 4'-kinase [Candidatus Poribacteria bacterium]
MSSAILKLALLKISWIYLGAAKLRVWLYSKDLLRTRHLPCKVISVGNIIAGGSGKTPTVIAIARMLRERPKLSVAVLSRGYRSKTRCSTVVSDGEEILLEPVEAGDEPYLLGHSLPGIPVLIGKDRFQTGLMAVRRWGCQVAILDDGFQHLRLARDIDIVIVDATRPFGLDHVLPRGYLREPLSALNRADLILLTRVDQCENLDSVRDRLTQIAPSIPIFESIYKPRSLRSLDADQEMGLDTVKGKNILAVCGIANPLSFAETVRSLGAAKVELLPFPDHHEYPSSSMEMIGRRATEVGADIIVTTEKDATKLRHVADYLLLSLAVDLELVGSTAKEFAKIIGLSVN